MPRALAQQQQQQQQQLAATDGQDHAGGSRPRRGDGTRRAGRVVPEEPHDGTWPWQPKKHSECKKFKYGMPTYLNQLADMFHGTTVDGRYSYVAGVDDDQADLNLDDEDKEDNVDLRSPMSTGSHKRANSTTDTATSPPKKHKSPMVKCMKDMIQTLQAGSSNDLEVAKQIQDHIAYKKETAHEKVDAEIERCLELAKECGATEESEEFYVATRQFADRYNRTVFMKLSTSAGRMAWLRRCCGDWSG
ncbi:hypothetical protein BS78_01G057300 [Paspalum vaginatum]|nr:hypothetical protein BS78_01G057300 [Paspalum vaginatum]